MKGTNVQNASYQRCEHGSRGGPEGVQRGSRGSPEGSKGIQRGSRGGLKGFFAPSDERRAASSVPTWR
eukprot:3573196-Pyramimonas_sp.AAC.1